MMSKNIVLIGMPGSGKTTIGKILYEKLRTDFIDMDNYIEDREGKTIPDIFKNGEDYFRKLEKEAVCEVSAKKSAIISTGGGVIKNFSNIENLKKNGIVIFIDRPVENIAKDINVLSRPLLKDGVGKLYELLDERYELYKKYSDFRIENNGKIEDVIEKILELAK
ncbi:shikimate kinase [Clostridium scatologenes]|uniref:Shikimate kinase n=1 Tax=Clostridium scatologenes TaxID=1548 RepID=A0A0E3GQL5_CLOSL|nr:shikimate kinase [Clostridium scatologenes]AKA68781.1 shikimate kinase [Clostridium scatologenes]